MKIDNVEVMRRLATRNGGVEARPELLTNAEALKEVCRDPAIRERLERIIRTTTTVVALGAPVVPSMLALTLTGIQLGADYAEAVAAQVTPEPKSFSVFPDKLPSFYDRRIIQDIVNQSDEVWQDGWASPTADASLTAALSGSPGKRALLDHICAEQVTVDSDGGDDVPRRRHDDEPSPYDGEITYAITRAELRVLLNKILRTGIHVGRKYAERLAGTKTSAAS